MARRYTAFPNGVKTWPRDDFTVVVTGGSDAVADADNIAGVTTWLCQGDTTITLGGLAANSGTLATIVNDNADGVGTVTISPNALDGIQFLGSATDDKDLINTAATSKRGDYVTLIASGATAWTVVDASGIWAKEP